MGEGKHIMATSSFHWNCISNTFLSLKSNKCFPVKQYYTKGGLEAASRSPIRHKVEQEVRAVGNRDNNYNNLPETKQNSP